MTPEVFAPAMLGPIQLRNRVIKAATFEGRTPHGLVSDELIAFHKELVDGGVGLTTIAYCAVAPEGRTHAEQMVVGPATAPGLARLADEVHACGGRISAQLGHAGPVANGRSNGVRALSASRMPSPLSMQMVRSASEADLTRITKAYAASARILVDSGFDVLEIHMSHSYLVSSFLAPGLNRRKDRWGGSLENRAKLARQVADAVRSEIGDEAAVIAKTSLSDGFRGGLTSAEGLAFAAMLEADGNLDALQLTGGSSLMNPMYLFRGGVPLREFAAQMPLPVRIGMRTVGKGFLKEYPFEEAYFLEKALAFRKALTMPLILLGGINSRQTMERAMELGFEYVALGRALVHEPGLVNRLADDPSGAGACIHCNRCMPTIYSAGGTHCPVLVEMGQVTAGER